MINFQDSNKISMTFNAQVEQALLQVGYDNLSQDDKDSLVVIIATKNNISFADVNQSYILNYHKTIKIATLNQTCDTTISNGFPSSALGSAHTYPSNLEAQTNFHTELTRFNLDPTYTVSFFKTLDAGYLPHNFAQLKQVFIDGHTYGKGQVLHYNRLKALINNATDYTSVNNVSWTTPPATPTGLTGTVSTGQVVLNWIANAEIDLAGYNVYQNGSKITSVAKSGTTYTVSSLTTGTYTFAITAFDVNENESPQATVTFTVA